MTSCDQAGVEIVNALINRASAQENDQLRCLYPETRTHLIIAFPLSSVASGSEPNGLGNFNLFGEVNSETNSAAPNGIQATPTGVTRIF